MKRKFITCTVLLLSLALGLSTMAQEGLRGLPGNGADAQPAQQSDLRGLPGGNSGDVSQQDLRSAPGTSVPQPILVSERSMTSSPQVSSVSSEISSSHNVETQLRLVDLNGSPDFLAGEQFDVQVHFQDLTNSGAAVFSGYANLDFDPAFLAVRNISYPATRPYLQLGTTGSGTIFALGATSNQLQVTQQTLVATVRMEVLQTGNTTLSLSQTGNQYAETTIFGNDNDQRANMQYASRDLTLGSCPNCAWENVNFVRNGQFSNGQTGWGFFGDGVFNIFQGELRFYRELPGFAGAVAFQSIPRDMPADAPLRTTLDLGNVSGTPKGVEIQVRAADRSQIIACSFTIPPTTAPTTVTIEGITNQAWTDMTLAVRALDPDNRAAIRVDNVSVEYKKYDESITGLACDGLATPPNTNLVNNGQFSSNFLYWIMYGDFSFQRVNGVLEFYRTASATRPAVLLQNTGYNLQPGTKFQSFVQVGNSSNVEKTIDVVIRDAYWSQAYFCTYTLPASTPLTYIRVQGETTSVWSNPMLLVREPNGTGEAAVRVDNFSLTTGNSINIQNQCGTKFGAGATAGELPRPVAEGEKLPTIIEPDNGIVPDTDGAAPAPVSPPNPDGIPEIPGF